MVNDKELEAAEEGARAQVRSVQKRYETPNMAAASVLANSSRNRSFSEHSCRSMAAVGQQAEMDTNRFLGGEQLAGLGQSGGRRQLARVCCTRGR